jgi:hypothetical protein
MSGYDTAIRQMTMNQDDQVTVELQQSPRPPQQPDQPWPYSGRYTLTFVASPSCTLPAEAKQRTYGASVDGAEADQGIWNLAAELDNAAFAVQRARGTEHR